MSIQELYTEIERVKVESLTATPEERCQLAVVLLILQNDLIHKLETLAMSERKVA